ncbi:K(+)-transporting ATPase subunit C [Desulfobacterium sp. N47]
MSGRIVLTTMFICCVLYTLTILGIGQIMAPYTANGSILQNDHGEVIGSEVLAQAFTRPEYFWPRPSAAKYDASATGGSNWSPTNPALRKRAEKIMARLGMEEGNFIPADMVTASGSGMDPHITLKSAKYQAARVAEARGISVLSVQTLLDRHAKRAGGFLAPEPLVNVLFVNMTLDKLVK